MDRSMHRNTRGAFKETLLVGTDQPESVRAAEVEEASILW